MPGPLSTWDRNYRIDDGTSCRAETPAPGPYGRARDPWTYERAKALYAAYEKALQYAPERVAERVGHGVQHVLTGLWPSFVEMLVVVGATTTIGGTIGGGLGFFFGGAGAAPGAVVGGQIGFDIGVAAITWLGLGFLLQAIVSGFGELTALVSSGVSRAWRAAEFGPCRYSDEVDKAGQELADAVAVLVLLIIQGLLAWILKRAAVSSTSSALARGRSVGQLGAEATADVSLAEAVAQLRKSKMEGLADWLEQNWAEIKADPRFRAQPKRPGSTPPEPEPPTPARTAKPPEDIANLMAARRKIAEQFYKDQGFSDHQIVQHLKGVDFTKPVDVVTLEPGTKLIQYQVPGGRQGNYYGMTEATPSELGISPIARDAAGNVVSKVPLEYTVKQPVQVLRSTAAAVEDTWSLSPYGAAQTKGGGTQFFSTQSGAFGGK